MITWLASSRGQLFAALILFVLIALAERAPWLAGKLEGKPVLKRALAIGIAAAGALAAALWGGLGWEQAVEVGLAASLGAAGLNAMLPGKLVAR